MAFVTTPGAQVALRPDYGLPVQNHLDTGGHPIRGEFTEPMVYATDTPTGFPDVYVNGEDHTVTIDPVGNSMWVRHDHERHARSQTRGRLKDHAGVLATQSVVDKHELPPRNFIPTSVHLDALDKFTPRCVANSSRGNPTIGRKRDSGRLPVISRMIWANELRDKPDWLVENEQWAATDIDRRMFDCGGNCR